MDLDLTAVVSIFNVLAMAIGGADLSSIARVDDVKDKVVALENGIEEVADEVVCASVVVALDLQVLMSACNVEPS